MDNTTPTLKLVPTVPKKIAKEPYYMKLIRNGVYEAVVLSAHHKMLPKTAAVKWAQDTDFVQSGTLPLQATHTRPNGRKLLGDVAKFATAALARAAI